MKEEILAGIKVAIENGSSSDSAKQSFINAGYNPQEVNAAAEMLASGISDILYPSDEHNHGFSPIEGEERFLQKKADKRKKRIVSLIVLITIVLLTIAGILAYLLLL